MSDETSLVVAIKSNPTDNLPRLVDADWLEENSRPICIACGGTGRLKFLYPEQACRCEQFVPDGRRERATFIRLQIELSSVPKRHEGRKPTRRIELENRIEEVFIDLFDEWCRNNYGDDESEEIDGEFWTGGYYKSRQEHVEVRWERGFVSQVRCRLIDWLGLCHDCRGRGADCSGPCFGSGVDIRNSLGWELVAAHPIEWATLTDREPDDLNLSRPPVNVFRWWEDDPEHPEDHAPSDLPVTIFELLWLCAGVVRGFGGGQYGATRWVEYSSLEAAIAALSNVLIAWANTQPSPTSP